MSPIDPLTKSIVGRRCSEKGGCEEQLLLGRGYSSSLEVPGTVEKPVALWLRVQRPFSLQVTEKADLQRVL